MFDISLENLKKVNFTKSFLVLLVLTGFLFVSGCLEIVGEWKGNDGNTITFYENSTFVIKSYEYDPNPPVPGPHGEPAISESGGVNPNSGSWRVKQQGTYEVDWDKDPVWIDFVGTHNGQVFRTEGLLREFSDNEIHISLLSGGNRPATFENGNIWVLNKVAN
jgi:hypothetical protein